MTIPPGLLCARCQLGFQRTLARRTHIGYIHATPCASPSVLVEGRWVWRGGVARWQGAESVAQIGRPPLPLQLTAEQRAEAHRLYARGDRTPSTVAGEREYQRAHKRAKRRAA